MAGCGGHCRCAGANAKAAEVCPTPKGGVLLDKEGKCPCGKKKEECCHKDTPVKEKDEKNHALGELCKPHGKQHLCG